MPRIPDQIIVTFEGKTREVLRIGQDEDGESERRGRPVTARRMRYYARGDL